MCDLGRAVQADEQAGDEAQGAQLHAENGCTLIIMSN
jgi:hypothetical protein